MIDDVQALLSLSKKVASSACLSLCNIHKSDIDDYEFSKDLPCEMKAKADFILEKKILSGLVPTGLPILSEETGDITGNLDTSLKFVVDPLDGTVNFVRGLGKAAVSIALYYENAPIFGVVAVYPTGDLIWGGKDLGAFMNGETIKVSDVADINESVICTGFPSRFQLNDTERSYEYVKAISHYGKVRMLGAASISLLNVAIGAAEIYVEHDIMLWDVAAGLSIVEGAGGEVSIEQGSVKYALNVEASNGNINFVN